MFHKLKKLVFDVLLANFAHCWSKIGWTDKHTVFYRILAATTQSPITKRCIVTWPDSKINCIMLTFDEPLKLARIKHQDLQKVKFWPTKSKTVLHFIDKVERCSSPCINRNFLWNYQRKKCFSLRIVFDHFLSTKVAKVTFFNSNSHNLLKTIFRKSDMFFVTSKLKSELERIESFFLINKIKNANETTGSRSVFFL